MRWLIGNAGPLIGPIMFQVFIPPVLYALAGFVWARKVKRWPVLGQIGFAAGVGIVFFCANWAMIWLLSVDSSSYMMVTLVVSFLIGTVVPLVWLYRTFHAAHRARPLDNGSGYKIEENHEKNGDNDAP
jgi:hypothetical protein